MDGADLMLTTPAMMPGPLETTAGAGPAGTEKTEQLAKDFESVLLTRIVDAMKETIGKSGFEAEDAASDQVHGLFWLYLARDIADKGGFGLWKDLSRFFNDLQKTDAPANPAPISESQAVSVRKVPDIYAGTITKSATESEIGAGLDEGL